MLASFAPRIEPESQLPLKFSAADKAHLIVEVAVHPQDVWMPQMALNLDLSPQLVLYITVLKLILEEHLATVADCRACPIKPH